MENEIVKIIKIDGVRLHHNIKMLLGREQSIIEIIKRNGTKEILDLDSEQNITEVFYKYYSVIKTSNYKEKNIFESIV